MGALNGLKSARPAFRSPLASYMESRGCLSCLADPEVKYYLCMLCYVNDISCIHHDSDFLFQCLHQSFPLKPGYVDPDMYLGAKLHKMRMNNGVWVWAMSATKYVHEAVRNCEVHLAANYRCRYKLPEQKFSLQWDMILRCHECNKLCP